MKLTKIQYKKLEELMPIVRKAAKVSNYKFMCAIFYIIENGCKWVNLPKKHEKWHIIYVTKNGPVDKAISFSL